MNQLKTFLKLFLITLPIFLAIDFVWIGFAARSFYTEQIGFLLKKSPNWTASILFYLLYTGGLVYFAILPAIREGSWMQALLRGALLGLVAYGTYDLTNLALVENWPKLVTVVDLAWGAILSAVVSAIAYWIGSQVVAVRMVI